MFDGLLSHPSPTSIPDETTFVFHHPAPRVSFPVPGHNSYSRVAATFRWPFLIFECGSESAAFTIQAQPPNLHVAANRITPYAAAPNRLFGPLPRACYLGIPALSHDQSKRQVSHIIFAMNARPAPIRISRLCLLAGILCFAAGIPARAQRLRGELHLEVHDPKGSTLAARGELLSEGNGFGRRFQIPADGHFVLQDLPFGVYRLNLTAEGFAVWSDVVEVHSEVPLKLGITLGVAPVTTQVQVTDELTLVDPTRTGTLYSIGKQSIREQLSLQPGRHLFDLVNQEPGWLYEGNGVLHPRGSEYDVQFVVDGQPLVQNRSPAFAPDMDSDSVESLRLLTASYPAEYGRKLGGIVELTTDKNSLLGWHGDFVASGGSFDQLDGSAAIRP